jgi:hypothetical protein
MMHHAETRIIKLMKLTPFLLLSLAFLGSPLVMAEPVAAPAAEATAAPTVGDEVKAAITKLAAAGNYSWTTSTVVPEGSRWRPGPSNGKTNADGYSWLSTTMGERTNESFIKGGKYVSKGEAGWQTAEERRAARENAGGGEGRGGRGGAGGGRGLENFKTPAQQAEEIVGKVKELKKDGDVVTGELTEEAVKSLLTMGGRRRDGSEAPVPTDTKGSIKLWMKDGALAKMETHVAGKLTVNGNEMTIDRKSTTEIKDIGATTLDVPEDVKKKL